MYKLLVEMRDLWDSRTLNALPDTWKEAKVAIRAQDMGTLYQPDAIRSMEWLEENGKCIDHIVPGHSTIDGAGHGAFAKRHLPKGTIITGSPLHQVPDQKTFHLYDCDEEQIYHKDGKPKRLDAVIGEQVALNYCFGHSESTLILCPYGSGVNYINHNKTLANVKIQWAEHGSTGHNASWLEMDPKKMKWNYKTILAFDYIATRDIAEGEELFLDYGDDWENTWQEHVDNWKPSDHWKDYLSATQYNTIHGTDRLRTLTEQVSHPYPENMVIRCHSYLLDEKYTQRPKVENDPKLQWKPPLDKGYTCEILDRNDEEGTYTVLVTYESGEDLWQQVMRVGVTRQSISFVDLPYSTDMHLLKAFRHPLGIPEDMMPDAWKTSIASTDTDPTPEVLHTHRELFLEAIDTLFFGYLTLK
jgi:hypothetical protein